MTDEHYQLRKTAIQERLRKAMLETERALLEATQRAASELCELEKEYRGIAPKRAADYAGNTCLWCGAAIAHGIAYCWECQERHDAIEASNPLFALNLMDKKACEAFFANPANLDNPLLERRGSDESKRHTSLCKAR